jgi:hypothetical protein
MEETLSMWEGEGGALESTRGGVTREAGGEPSVRIGQVEPGRHKRMEPFNETEWTEQTKKRLLADFEQVRKLLADAVRKRGELDREGTTLIARA